MRAAAVASVAGRTKERFIVNLIVHPGAGAPPCLLLFGAVQLPGQGERSPTKPVPSILQMTWP
jgi:hypothetical protein